MTRARNVLVVVVAVLLDGLVVWGIVAEGYRAGANLLPAAVALAMTLLCVPITWPDPTRRRQERSGTRASIVSASGLVWLALLALAVLLLGFRLGLPVYASAYAVFQGIRPARAIILGLIVASAIEGVFVRTLGLPLPTGWIDMFT